MKKTILIFVAMNALTYLFIAFVVWNIFWIPPIQEWGKGYRAVFFPLEIMVFAYSFIASKILTEIKK